MKTKLLTALQKKTISKNSCQYEIGNRFVSWRRVLQVTLQRKGTVKTSFVGRCCSFQLVLISQWTVATLLGVRSRDGTGRQKDKVYDTFGCFGCTKTARRCLVPRPHYYAWPMRFGSSGPRKFLRSRQTRRSETFCLTWGGTFMGSRRAVNNPSALMKDVQQPWRLQRIKS